MYICIFIYGYLYILDFPFYIGSIYNIISLKVYKLHENEEEKSNTSFTGSLVYLRYLYQEKDITLLFQKQLFIDIPRNM